MGERRLGIIMNGVTGRMGTNQHLIRSILEIRRQGGTALADGTRAVPDPILVGRNAEKVRELASAHGLTRWSADLDAALANREDALYFDATSTAVRAANVRKALAAGKHVYCEKPAAATTAEAMALYRLARQAGVKHGVVQDKLWLPGLRKLKRLVDSGFFGRILAVQGNFGYWVFEGDWQPAQRPSWNYRREEGGGLILDMLSHWRYLFDNLFGPVKAVCCLGAIHVPERWDEHGQRYPVTAEDAAYATFELEGGIVVQMNSSWTTRVRRDDLLTLQVDGTHGSAVAGLRRCFIQPRAATPRPVWNPDVPSPINYFADWQEVPDTETYDNAFKAQWELFLRHLCEDVPFPWDLREGAKGVQLAELAHDSWAKRCWVEVPDLEA
jgi:predicted dehydrogenase